MLHCILEKYIFSIHILENVLIRYTLNLDLIKNEDKMSDIKKYLRIPIVTFIEID